MVWCLTLFSTVFHLYCQCTHPCFPGILLTRTLHNTCTCILSKLLTAFSHDHCQNNGQRRERNESCRNNQINPGKEYWPSRGSNQRRPVLKSGTKFVCNGVYLATTVVCIIAPVECYTVAIDIFN